MSANVVWLLISLVVFAIFGFFTGSFAARKGYNFIVWFLAGGIWSLIILAFLPDTNDGFMGAEDADRQRRTGNIVGGVLAVLPIGITIVRIATGH